MDIKEIPTEELFTDMLTSTADAKACLVLNGQDVEWIKKYNPDKFVKQNRHIIKVCKAELIRRMNDGY